MAKKKTKPSAPPATSLTELIEWSLRRERELLDEAHTNAVNTESSTLELGRADGLAEMRAKLEAMRDACTKVESW